MSHSIQIFAQPEIDLVKSGDIDGAVYSDGQVWAEVVSLLWWREHGLPYIAQGCTRCQGRGCERCLGPEFAEVDSKTN